MVFCPISGLDDLIKTTEYRELLEADPNVRIPIHCSELNKSIFTDIEFDKKNTTFPIFAFT